MLVDLGVDGLAKQTIVVYHNAVVRKQELLILDQGFNLRTTKNSNITTTGPHRSREDRAGAAGRPHVRELREAQD